MSTTNFFRVNLPYGMKKLPDGNWFLFNRNYAPIGWIETEEKGYSAKNPYPDVPIHGKYKELSDEILKSILKDSELIQLNDDGSINSVWFYQDRTNPSENPQYWTQYSEILQSLSKYEV